jgi:thioredoxin reductase
MPYIRCFTTAGGQLSELYPKKANLRYPGFPEVLAGDLVDNLMEQIKQFEPGFTLENVLKRLKNKKTAVLL